MKNTYSAVTLNSCEKIKNNPSPFILIPDEDACLFTILQECTKKLELPSAHVFGIGSIKNIEMSFYNHDINEPQIKLFSGIYEIVFLTGTITQDDSKPFIHLHGSIGDANYHVFGGYFIKAQAGAATELSCC